MGILLVNESEIRKLVTLDEAVEAMEEAFVAYSTNASTVPPVVSLEIPEHQGEVHIKAAHLHSTDEYVIKVAAGFWENRKKNLPIGSGLMMVFSAITGYPEAILLDNGYLTELRTAAAGAVAAKYMAPRKVRQVAVIGAGAQGRFQLEALACVRSFESVIVYDHHDQNIARYLVEMRPRIQAEIRAARTVAEAVEGSQVILTATPSRKPFLRPEWVNPGSHFSALGSDGPDKQELEVEVLSLADRIIADSISQCVQLGEIHHAVAKGILRQQDVDGELGDVVQGRVPGREGDQEITICDLTGVGVQDAAISRLVFQKAKQGGIGTRFA